MSSASVGGCTSRLQSRSPAYMFCVLLAFSRKRETARSLYRHLRSFLTGNFCSIRLSHRKFRNFLLKGSFIRIIFNTRIFFKKPISGLSGNFPNPFCNFRNFCLDGKHAKSRDKIGTTVPGYSILPKSDESKKPFAQSKVCQ